MAFTVTVLNENEKSVTIKAISLPDTCPICDKAIETRARFGYIYLTFAQIIFQCPRNDCRSLFIAYYKHSSGSYYFRNQAPLVPKGRIFSEEIQKISEIFCDIFNEASKAEQSGWVQIAGGGTEKLWNF